MNYLKRGPLAGALLLGICSLFLTGVSVQAQSPGINAYKQGQTLEREKRLEEAVEKYAEAVRLDPRLVIALVRKGNAELRLKRYNDARASFNAALAQKPDLVPAHRSLATIYAANKDYKNAVNSLNLAAQYDTSKARKINFKLAAVTFMIKDRNNTGALAEIARLKAQDPNNPRIYAAEGDAQAGNNNWTASAASYQQAIAKAGSNPAYVNQMSKYNFGLGLAYFKAGKKEEAEAAWAKVTDNRYRGQIARTKQEASGQYFVYAALGYMRANFIDEAIASAQKATQSQEPTATAYKLLASLQVQKNQVGAAIASYGKAIELEKDAAQKNKLLMGMARLQLRNNDFNGALTSANRILANAANDYNALGLKAQAEYSLGRYVNAVATAKAAAEAVPSADVKRRAPYHFLQGMAAKKAGNTQEALEAFKLASVDLYRFAATTESRAITGAR